MKKQKRLSLWLDKDLANVFQKLNHKVNKSLFEHEFRFCFSIYHISYIDSSELLNFRPQSFSNPANAGTKSFLVISDPTAFCN